MLRLTESNRPRIPALALLAVVGCWPYLASPAAAAPFGVPDEIAEKLVADLEERYEVITLSRGYVLRPLASSKIELIEIDEGRVLVDGKPYELEALRELLGDDAEIAFALTGAAEDLAGPAELRRRLAEEQRAAARQLEESIRQQVERLQHLDRERVEQLGDMLERRRRRPRAVRTEARVSLGSSLTVKEDESAREVVVIFGPLDVRGEVRGDTVVVFGSAEIDGELGGEITVVGGNLSIGPDAVIDGNVTCVGGVIHRAAEARVDGEITEVSLAPLSFDLPGVDFEAWSPFRGWWPRDHRGLRWLDLIGAVGGTIVLAVLILLTVLIAGRRVASVADRARLEPWKAGLIGFVVEVLVLPVLILLTLLLAISVVGLPVIFVLWPLAILLLLVLFFVGYAGVAVALGRTTAGARLDPRQLSPFVAVVIGLLLVQTWSIFGHGLAVTGGFVRVAGYLLIALGFVLKYLVWTVGLGAVVLDRFSPLPAAVPAMAPPPPLPDLPDDEADEDVLDVGGGTLPETEEEDGDAPR